jgi:hypothetical protein
LSITLKFKSDAHGICILSNSGHDINITLASIFIDIYHIWYIFFISDISFASVGAENTHFDSISLSIHINGGILGVSLIKYIVTSHDFTTIFLSEISIENVSASTVLHNFTALSRVKNSSSIHISTANLVTIIRIEFEHIVIKFHSCITHDNPVNIGLNHFDGIIGKLLRIASIVSIGSTIFLLSSSGVNKSYHFKSKIGSFNFLPPPDINICHLSSASIVCSDVIDSITLANFLVGITAPIHPHSYVNFVVIHESISKDFRVPIQFSVVMNKWFFSILSTY